MQPVDFISEVQNAVGAFGYSVLQRRFGRGVERMTLLFLRGADGVAASVVILPADVVRGAF